MRQELEAELAGVDLRHLAVDGQQRAAEVAERSAAERALAHRLLQAAAAAADKEVVEAETAAAAVSGTVDDDGPVGLWSGLESAAAEFRRAAGAPEPSTAGGVGGGGGGGEWMLREPELGTAIAELGPAAGELLVAGAGGGGGGGASPAELALRSFDTAGCGGLRFVEWVMLMGWLRGSGVSVGALGRPSVLRTAPRAPVATAPVAKAASSSSAAAAAAAATPPASPAPGPRESESEKQAAALTLEPVDKEEQESLATGTEGTEAVYELEVLFEPPADELSLCPSGQIPGLTSEQEQEQEPGPEAQELQAQAEEEPEQLVEGKAKTEQEQGLEVETEEELGPETEPGVEEEEPEQLAEEKANAEPQVTGPPAAAAVPAGCGVQGLYSALFDAVDVDGSGAFDKAEGATFLGFCGCEAKQLEYIWADLVKSADTDHDGTVSKAEFLRYVTADVQVNADGGFVREEERAEVERELTLARVRMGAEGEVPEVDVEQAMVGEPADQQTEEEAKAEPQAEAEET